MAPRRRKARPRLTPRCARQSFLRDCVARRARRFVPCDGREEIVPLQRVEAAVDQRRDSRGPWHVAEQGDLAEVVALIGSRPQTLRTSISSSPSPTM